MRWVWCFIKLKRLKQVWWLTYPVFMLDYSNALSVWIMPISSVQSWKKFMFLATSQRVWNYAHICIFMVGLLFLMRSTQSTLMTTLWSRFAHLGWIIKSLLLPNHPLPAMLQFPCLFLRARLCISLYWNVESIFDLWFLDMNWSILQLRNLHICYLSANPFRFEFTSCFVF